MNLLIRLYLFFTYYSYFSNYQLELVNYLGQMAQVQSGLKLYPVGKTGSYIGKINVDKTQYGEKINTELPEMIVILDVSGSMGGNVQTIVNQILPQTLLNLGYTNNSVISIIAFTNYATFKTHKVGDLPTLREYRALNGTCMKSAIDELKKYFDAKKAALLNGSKTKTNIRILSISDGDLNDQEQTIRAASELNVGLEDFRISSQAVRYFTSSYGQPDTRGLSSVMQFSNVSTPKLCDLNATRIELESLIATFTSLFNSDGLKNSVNMVCDSKCMKSSPWATVSNVIQVSEGDNAVWFDSLPQNITVNNKAVTISLDNMSKDNFNEVLKTQIDFYMTQLKVLKVVNSEESITRINQIISYFKELEEQLFRNESDLLVDGTLNGRIKYFKSVIEKRNKSITTLMSQIASDGRVAKLNSAQQAEYLRNVNVTKNGKGLARIAATRTGDAELIDIVRDEIRKMHQNLAELDTLDWDDHDLYPRSFYSQSSTIEGIKGMCSLVDDGMLDDVTFDDLIQMSNIVGVACDSPIGDYPDPMVWRVTSIYPGSFVALSDLLAVQTMTHQKNGIQLPGTDQTFNNVIPYFPCDRLHLFYKKYAPTFLDVIAGIGMRRVLAYIPMTHAYSLAAAVWKFVEVLSKPENRTEINCTIFSTLIKSFRTVVGKHFEHVNPHLLKDQDPNLSFYIENNGMTNMISPLIDMIRTKQTQNLQRIMRAIYSYEFYQVTRREAKRENAPNPVEYADNKLLELINGNIEQEHVLEPTAHFTPDHANPTFYDNYKINEALFKTILEQAWYIDYVAFVPCLFTAAFADNYIEAIRALQPLNDDLVCKTMGINYPLKDFKFHNIVMGFKYNTKNDRVDDEKELMKIPDISTFENGDKFIRAIVHKKYADKYYHLVQLKHTAEKNIVCDTLVDNLIKSESMDEFHNLLTNGFDIAGVQYAIANTTSKGAKELLDKLADRTLNVPLRLEKICSVVIAHDENDNVLWNNGSIVNNISHFKELFIEANQAALWDSLIVKYRSHPFHNYRNGPPNRHGHSNDKKSYWALGFNTIEEMIGVISKTEWQEYKKLHQGCCGIDALNQKQNNNIAYA